MITEEEVLTALDKPRTIHSLHQRLNPSYKNTEVMQELLMRMRAEGKVKFDIHAGRWSKA